MAGHTLLLEKCSFLSSKTHSLFSFHCSCPSLSLPSILILALLFSSSMLTTNLKQFFHLNALYNDSQFYTSSPDLSLKFQTHISNCFLKRISERYSERKGKGRGEVSIFNRYLSLLICICPYTGS